MKVAGKRPQNFLAELFSAIIPRSTIAPEGWPRILGLFGVGLAFRIVSRALKKGRLSKLAGFLGQNFTRLSFVCAFAYRDPQRVPLGNAADYIYAPVDGKIIAVESIAEEPLFLGGPAMRIAITSHILDVPVERTPLPGQVRYIHQHSSEPGKIGLETAEGLRFFLTFREDREARLRLPVPLGEPNPIFIRAEAGQTLAVCDKIAVRGFGVPLVTTVYLPAEGVEMLCFLGQHAQAGMTVIGRIPPP